MSDATGGPADDGAAETGAGPDSDVPEWDDEYLDRVSDRLAFNYDLETDRVVDGERFELYGHMELHSRKHFLHPAVSFAHHETHEHLFARRVDRVDERSLDRCIDLGHRLADSGEWIDPDEEHYCTEFTFALVAPSIPDDVRDRVSGFRDRTMLKHGYHGHYEVNLLVVSPADEALVASEEADVATAFRLWEEIEREEPGILDLIARRLQL